MSLAAFIRNLQNTPPVVHVSSFKPEVFEDVRVGELLDALSLPSERGTGVTCEHGTVGYCEKCALRDPGELGEQKPQLVSGDKQGQEPLNKDLSSLPLMKRPEPDPILDAPRYEVQRITDGKQFGAHVEFRVTDRRTDSRIATCYDRTNAEFIVNALNAVPSARVPISVQDRLPEEDGHHVLCFNSKNRCWFTAYRDDHRWVHANGDGSPRYEIHGVTHWMPLPDDPSSYVNLKETK